MEVGRAYWKIGWILKLRWVTVLIMYPEKEHYLYWILFSAEHLLSPGVPFRCLECFLFFAPLDPPAQVHLLWAVQFNSEIPLVTLFHLNIF